MVFHCDLMAVRNQRGSANTLDSFRLVQPWLIQFGRDNLDFGGVSSVG